jgi:hypothetical protein
VDSRSGGLRAGTERSLVNNLAAALIELTPDQIQQLNEAI